MTLHEPWKDVSFKIGRQRFKDEREWLYDNELDAMRLFYDWQDVEFEFSIAREELIGRDILNSDSDNKDRINYYVASVLHEPSKDFEVGAYLLVADDRSSVDESPTFAGLRAVGEIYRNLDSWLDLAVVRGSDGPANLRGFGFDTGATYTFADALYRPYVTLGYAFGSGDDDPDADTDTSFRQTGLQDNAARLGGVARVSYYGEMLDPELSNLSIFTLGAGFRPSRRSSIELIYHRYRQVQVMDELRDAQIDEDPDGENKKLGSEIDLVAGYREVRNTRFEMALGYFIPGRARCPVTQMRRCS